MLQGMMKTERPAQEVSLFYKLCLGVTHGMGKLVPYKTKLKWYDAASQIGNKKQSRTLGLYNDLFKYLNLTYSRSMFKEYMDVPFEDLTLPITKEYDNYLSTVYGDYMTPPDENERNPIHMD